MTRVKPEKEDLRLIIDCRPANAATEDRPRLTGKQPGLEESAALLAQANYATQADGANYFYQFPLAQTWDRYLKLPGNPDLAISKLPMGLKEASDTAAAVSAAVAQVDPRTLVRHPEPGKSGALVATDNILVVGITRGDTASGARRTDAIRRWLGIEFGHEFEDPHQIFKWLGLTWDLTQGTRHIPERAAKKMRAILTDFAKSRGRLRLKAWRRAAGLAGWIAAAASLDPTARAPLVCGMRAATYRGSATPGHPARQAALAHARAALQLTPLAAPATATRHPARFGTPNPVHSFASDAAKPGLMTVVELAPRPRLLWSRPTPQGWAITHAEAMAHNVLGQIIRRRKLPAAHVFIDASAVFYSTSRGLARSEPLTGAAASIRTAAPHIRLSLVRSADNPLADVHTRPWLHDPRSDAQLARLTLRARPTRVYDIRRVVNHQLRAHSGP